MSLKLGGADDSSPDLIVHGVLGMERSMDQIREEMRGILERLVRIHPLLLFFISTLDTTTQSTLYWDTVQLLTKKETREESTLTTSMSL
jgi:hypothetical protein